MMLLILEYGTYLSVRSYGLLCLACFVTCLHFLLYNAVDTSTLQNFVRIYNRSNHSMRHPILSPFP
jgi:hypothetical protein